MTNEQVTRFPKRRSKRSRKIGLPPGTVIHLGENKPHQVSLRLIKYSSRSYEDRTASGLEALKIGEVSSDEVAWVHIDGIHDVGIISQIGERFGIHALVLEDIVNPNQRPKVEFYDGFVFVVLKMPTYDEKDGGFRYEQLSLILKPPYLISFVQDPGDLFDPIRERIKVAQGPFRGFNADYLLYALIDTVVDHHFIVLEKMGDIIEELEESIITDRDPMNMKNLYRCRRELLFLRKSLWGTREAAGNLMREEVNLIRPQVRLFMRDVYDHLIYMMDTVETSRDIIAGIMDIHLSTQSHRLNEVMKVLTLIATIFIPLTFVVGVYGMNFDFMPELRWKYGYPAVWALMITLSSVMMYYFRKKGWLGSGPRE